MVVVMAPTAVKDTSVLEVSVARVCGVLLLY
jgi:hypothetical protein